MRATLSWDFTQSVIVVFIPTFPDNLSVPSREHHLTFEDGSTGCPETSVRPKEGRFHLLNSHEGNIFRQMTKCEKRLSVKGCVK